MRSKYHYVAAKGADGLTRYVTGLGADSFVLWTPGHFALSMAAHTADRIAESLQADGQDAFVIKSPKMLVMQNPPEKKFKLMLRLPDEDVYMSYETSCGQIEHALGAFRKDCERTGITMCNASFSRAELRDMEGNVIEASEM